MKDYQILQIAPLVSENVNFGEYCGSIIGMALIEKEGKRHLTYILHDIGSGQPVLHNVTLTQPQNYFLEDDI